VPIPGRVPGKVALETCPQEKDLLSAHGAFSAAEKHFEDSVQPAFLDRDGLRIFLRLLRKMHPYFHRQDGTSTC